MSEKKKKKKKEDGKSNFWLFIVFFFTIKQMIVPGTILNRFLSGGKPQKSYFFSGQFTKRRRRGEEGEGLSNKEKKKFCFKFVAVLLTTKAKGGGRVVH